MPGNFYARCLANLNITPVCIMTSKKRGSLLFEEILVFLIVIFARLQ